MFELNWEYVTTMVAKTTTLPTKVFFMAIYHQKVTQNPHMWFDMKEIKN